MKTLGVTGGIGSGKTTVCRMLEELGARVFYADHEAKRILEEDAEARQEIVKAFGAKSYLPGGGLNRAFLAQTVFAEADKVERINAIVHPRVFKHFQEAVTQAREDGVPLMVKEAALIFESGGDRFLDAVVVVDAPKEERVKRVVERDDVGPEDVQARMGHQLPPEELRRRADYLIDNSGSLEKTRTQVEEVYAKMTES